MNDDIEREIEDHQEPYIVAAVIGLVLVAWEWVRVSVSRPLSPWYVTVFGLLIAGYCVFRLVQRREVLRRLRLGRDGEKVVSEFLDQKLRVKGCAVFHDVVGEGFNIDHVVLSTKGFLTIETKAYSMPDKERPEIEVTEEGLSIDGGKPDKAILNQSSAQASWLKQLLEESTGKRWPVRPVILFPSWFIHPNETKAFKDRWVLNPRVLPAFLLGTNEKPKPDKISREDVHLAAMHLSMYIRAREGNAKNAG